MPAIKEPEQRRNRHKPAIEFKDAPGYGWQHGRKPRCPNGLTEEAKEAWHLWLSSYAAAFWTAADITGLHVAIRLYDRQMTEPTAANATVLRQYLDAYGLTPAGLAKRRWRPPKPELVTVSSAPSERYERLRIEPGPYSHLPIVSGKKPS